MHYAARFAAKEAVAKALGTGFAEGVGWADIEVHAWGNGAPTVVLHGGAARVATQPGDPRAAQSYPHAQHGWRERIVVERHLRVTEVFHRVVFSSTRCGISLGWAGIFPAISSMSEYSSPFPATQS